MNAPERRYLSIDDLRAGGYLQEANRRFFHPLGLALEVTVAEDGSGRISGVWDCRDDPEGVVFADDLLDPELAAKVSDEWARREFARVALLGFVIQPIPR